LSEVSHHNPAKKRRVSSSSLSDAEDIDDDDDEEEDRPLAARITVGVRSVPGKRSGKQVPGKKSKKSHAALSGAPSTNNRPKTNGKVNGINGHETKVKVEDKMDENQLSRLTAGVPVDSVGRSSVGVCSDHPFLFHFSTTIIHSRQ
jgi:histone acetyltransferase